MDATTIGPGHDGRAELVVRLRHPNGACTTISVDEEALDRLLARTDIASVDDLRGRRWPDLTLDAEAQLADELLASPPERAADAAHRRFACLDAARNTD